MGSWGKTRGIASLLCICAFAGAASPTLSATEYSDAVQRKLGDMHNNLEQLEDLILNIERGLKQSSFGSQPQAQVAAVGATNTGGESAGGALAQVERYPTNAKCFNDIDQPLSHPELIAYRDQISGVTTDAYLQLEALEVLLKGQNAGACEGTPGVLLKAAETQINVISRRDLVGLVFHLQSCWVSENEKTTGDTRIDPDSIYLDFAEQLRLFDDSRRRIARTKERCE